ncbi:peptide chain release factor N(5)-glutamine methyltransferase [Noviherbaspirillum massiliense]|uniref:peptide chain release factor N(5)-glutamine methyltransferase n=1 Tax=Noviherbaspirillum massiliense TaxID=1465823 RepID=UPI000474B095|nr:peptide chain release factor N(5)-glutamine methyltransferase [Noviherbaspirillum massiliense]
MPSRDSALVAPGAAIGSILRKPPIDPLEGRILLSHALGLSRVQLVTQSERELSAEEAQTLSELFQRRLQGEPIAYITGEREFFGLPFHVTPDVLIPRPETELLVELALERLPRHGRVLDLGTGSGAIAVVLAATRSDASVTAIDLSAAALTIAMRNAERNRANVTFLQGSWYSPLGNEQFDLIVSNPPYIAAGDRHLSEGDLRFEPASALTDHADGLSALRTIVSGAGKHLAPGGWLLMEHGYDQAAAVRDLLAQHGYCARQSWKDLAGIERVSGATR